MCVVSNIIDGYRDKFPDRWPNVMPYTQGPVISDPLDGVSRAEFNKLKTEVEELKKLLKAAKIFDEKTGQPDCEAEEKVELVRKIAKLVGVDLGNVFGEKRDD